MVGVRLINSPLGSDFGLFLASLTQLFCPILDLQYDLAALCLLRGANQNNHIWVQNCRQEQRQAPPQSEVPQENAAAGSSLRRNKVCWSYVSPQLICSKKKEEQDPCWSESVLYNTVTNNTCLLPFLLWTRTNTEQMLNSNLISLVTVQVQVVRTGQNI